MSYIFRTYAQVAQDITAWSQRLPRNICAAAGVPRSGLIPASMLALHRNIHCVPLEEVLNGERPWEQPLRRSVPAKNEGMLLVLDDTSWGGGTMREIKTLFPPSLGGIEVKFAAVYAGDQGIPELDYFCRRVSVFEHSFEWNVLHDALAERACIDLDGVVCEDWGRPDDGEHLGDYLRFLETATPLRTPTAPVLAIVTARLEKYRPQTETWLARHGVRYQHLVMSRAQTNEQRRRMGFWQPKAAFYRRQRDARLFVESDHEQAVQIARATGRPVLSFGRLELLNGMEPDPPLAAA